ncbi:MAG TPA: M23 family metallopeptidase [Longimicrobiales bacterium]|nr:M23 family metallopeptidase [Longimicrobiales bacterium]
MAHRRWTLLIIPDGQESMRQMRVSQLFARAVFTGLAGLIGLLLFFATGFFVKESQQLRADRLAEENQRLVAQLDRLGGRLDTLQVSMADLTQRDEQYRLIAGLQPLDAEIQQAGIGGPGTETLEGNALYSIDAELGQRAFAATSDVEAMIRRADVLKASWSEAVDSLRVRHALLQATPSIFPTRGIVTSGFTRARMHPILHRARPHEGLDIVAPRGTPIRASANGVVSFSGRRGGYGLVVEIDHGYGMKTRYAHMSALGARVGQRIERAEEIGLVGSTGLSVSPHLHYEVLMNGVPQNPALYILDGEVIPD